ncbi:MAG: hypothetical protein AB7F35_16600 [Acetobacteraceae bacterium]
MPRHAGKPAACGRYTVLGRVTAAVAQLRHGFADAAEDAAACAHADAGLYLADTCAWLQAWQHNADEAQWHGDDFSATQDQYFPQP